MSDIVQQPWLTGMEAEQRARDRSQFFTPPDLATRMWRWAIGLTDASPVPQRHALSVLEPSAGRGALIRPILEEPYGCGRVVAVEADPRHVEELTGLARASAVPMVVDGADCLSCVDLGTFDLALMNPPFENGGMTRFPEHALRFARRCVSLSPASIFFSEGRADFWRWHDVARGVRFASRPQFGGDFSPATDFVLLELVRRQMPRRQDDATVESWEWWS